MEIQLTSNYDAAVAAIGRTAASIETAANAGVRAATKAAYDIDRAEINKIYAILEDRAKSGRKVWRRKGTLRRGETMTFPGLLTGLISNDTPYAQPRHDLNRVGRSGVNRIVHWRTATAEAAPGPAMDAFQRAFEARLAR